MAFLSHQMTYPMRPMHKEPQWNSMYDDLFNQYIDTDQLESSDFTKATNDMYNLDDLSRVIDSADSSLSSCQPGSSPIHIPSTKNSDQAFWANAIRSLEQSAACLEHDQSISLSGDQQRNPHTPETDPLSDFLSLGGWPSPHIPVQEVPVKTAQRRKASVHVHNNTKRVPTPRSPGVKKSHRKASKPPKMMSPSRYTAAFAVSQANKTSCEMQDYTWTLPMRSAPLSPPPSAKLRQTVDAAAFCSPREVITTPYEYASHFAEELSPTSRGFQCPARANTPNASPLTSSGVERAGIYGDLGNDDVQEPFNGRSAFYAVPPTTPRSIRTSWITPSTDDDNEVFPMFNPWTVGNTERGRIGHPSIDTGNALGKGTAHIPSHPLQAQDLANSGLMIYCDPTFITSDYDDLPDNELFALPRALRSMAEKQQEQGQELQRQERSTSASPSSPHEQPGRSPRATSKRRGRRPGSTTRSPRGLSSMGFVNFTSSDSAKLLTGVAPSGSSKTKARRDKEAAEKRRKFSQAAVKAVTDAGGDVNRLRDVML